MSSQWVQLDVLYGQASKNLAERGYERAAMRDILVVAVYELKLEMRGIGFGERKTRSSQAKDWGVKGTVIALLVALVELVQKLGS